MTTPALDAVCESLAAFIDDRASHGDASARGLEQGLRGTKHAPPPLSMVRSWLKNVSSEVWILVVDGRHTTARHLEDELRAADASSPGAMDRAWTEYVARRRAGGR
jgi:hypothetical protein